MDDTEPDTLVFEQMMQEPQAITELERVHQLLDASIQRSKFNLERAEQMFRFLVDNCAYRYFRQFPGGARILFPNTVRQPFAAELLRQYVSSRNNVTSQRPARRGLLCHVIGK